MKIGELLYDENRWTQNAVARNKDGRTVDSLDESAVRWCLNGAIRKCYGSTHIGEGWQVYKKLLTAAQLLDNRFTILSSFNDNNDWKDIKNLLEKVDV